MNEVFISFPLRTPIGKYGGSLKDFEAPRLAGFVIKEILRRSNLNPKDIDDVILGNVVQAGEKMNPARQAAIFGGVDETVPAFTVNRVCGSGLQAIISGVMEIEVNYSKIVIAGGMENMDLCPYLIMNGRWGYRMGDGVLYDSMLRDGLNDAFSDKHSGLITEEFLIPKYGITREEQDKFSYESHMKAAKAQESGFFKDQIVGITLKDGTLFDFDESVRKDTTIEKLSKLKPAFKKDGTITAGNAPGLNSGAACMILSNYEKVKEYNFDTFGRVVSYGVSAVDPNMFGIAPVYAIKKALERANLKIDDIDLFEINEAFAAIALAVKKELEIPDEKLNVNGGAIALGHPIGATGAILVVKLLHELRRRGGKYGIASLCIGGGQGIAILVERV
ncbi:MAG: acetyl-CoA C-acetyltransferase [Caldisericia bacterium]|jgi:acetyl-CoA C-acetyltransferase|nr:acetyl-CoA C-acetyltransferase [Caldisericia bacterium]